MLMIRAVKAMVAEVTARCDDGDGPAGYTPMHGIAARYIADNERVTPGELAAHLRITKQSVSEIIAALEAGGYVQRLPHPDDGRARILRLTARGVTDLEKSRARWHELMLEWQAELQPDDLDTVARALQTYLDAETATA